MKGILFGMMCVWSLLSYGQKEVVGVVVRFSEEMTQTEQTDLLMKNEITDFDQLIPLPGFDVTLLELSTSEMTSYSALAEQLEALPEVQFTSPFYKTIYGGYGGDLDKIFVREKQTTDWSLFGTSGFTPSERFEGVWELTVDKSDLPIREVQKILRSTGQFAFVVVNTLHSVVTASEPYYEYQWALENSGTEIQYSGTPGADTGVSDAWTVTTGSPDIKIAVLDSGTDTNHVDLVDNLLPGYDATGGGQEGYPNTTYPNDAHGTCCAGIIAANGENEIGVSGVAYTSKIIPVRIFYYVEFGGDVIPFTSGEAGVNGIDWAVNEGDADIISNSWGLRDSDIELLGIDTTMSNMVLEDGIENGRDGKGVPMLFSSGNEADPYSIWPAIHPKTISVGASTMCDELKKPTDCSPEGWWGSNYGDGLDVVAPGVKVLTTDMTGDLGYNSFMDNDYSMFNGTSAACPNAAGVMALILSAEPELTAYEARAILSVTAFEVDLYDFDMPASFGWRSEEIGYGRVDAFEAMNYVLYSLGTDDEGTEPKDYVVYGAAATTLHLGDQAERIQLLNTAGQVIQQTEVLGELNVSIALGDQAHGIYLVRIFRENEITTLKVML